MKLIECPVGSVVILSVDDDSRLRLILDDLVPPIACVEAMVVFHDDDDTSLLGANKHVIMQMNDRSGFMSSKTYKRLEDAGMDYGVWVDSNDNYVISIKTTLDTTPSITLVSSASDVAVHTNSAPFDFDTYNSTLPNGQLVRGHSRRG